MNNTIHSPAIKPIGTWKRIERLLQSLGSALEGVGGTAHSRHAARVASLEREVSSLRDLCRGRSTGTADQCR